MATRTQEKLNVKLETILEPDTLLVRQLSGTERLSSPFELSLELYSEKGDLDERALLRSKMTVWIEPDRYFHGYVRSFSQMGAHGDLTAYRAVLVPRLWFLHLSRESRVFHEADAPSIIEQVFEERGIEDVSFQLTGTYEAREYRIQYRESDFDFVSRLMEEEGIFYYFDHTKSGCELVVADHASAHRPVEPDWAAELSMGRAADEEGRAQYIRSLTRDHRVHVGTITLRDVNTDRSMDPMDASESSRGEELELYDYPSRYLSKAEGDRLARVRVEEEEAEAVVLSGTTEAPPLQPGRTFSVADHVREDFNDEYLLVEVNHFAQNGSFRGGDETDGYYENHFQAIPADTPFRPRRATPRPVIPGIQTARVVAGDGNTVHTDRLGRVKVQFFWDREGKGDEKSSCWIRVATGWAGLQRGILALPRVNDEVVVEFLEGDPDRPIIVGAVWNDSHDKSPWDLPGEATRTGIRSATWGTGKGFNELSLDDKDGEELVYVHAQKDMSAKVLNDQRTQVHRNLSEKVGNDRSREVGADEKVTVAANRTIEVGEDHHVEVGGDDTCEVMGDTSLTVAGKQETTIADTASWVSGKKMKLTTGENFELTIGQKGDVTAAQSVGVTAGQSISLTAGQSITLQAGPAKIELGPAGVTITAPQIQLQGAIVKVN
jgi:type VI secretion system secreted protein VgrG